MPQLKVYQSKESRDSWLPHAALGLLGERRDQQGKWFIVAHTAAEAVEITQCADVPYAESPRRLRVAGYGDDADMLRTQGYLATPGEVIGTLGRTNGPVARFLHGTWSLIGRFEYDQATRETVFTAEEN